MESIDECVSWLNQQILDLLNLRGVVARLSTNWEQLKLSLTEKGLLGEDFESKQTPETSVQPDQAATVVRKDNSLDEASGGGEDSQNTRLHPDNQEWRVEHSGEDCQTETVAGQTGRDFIGPVRPSSTAESAGGYKGGQSTDQSGVVCTSIEGGAESVVDPNQNGSMETTELATAQSSGLQMR